MNPHLLALGFTLLHFCWQAALIAGAYKTAEILLPGLKPNARYQMALLALLAMLVIAVLTFAHEEFRLSREVTITVNVLPDASEINGQTSAPLFGGDVSLHSLLPWLDMVWIMGVLALTLKMAGGLWQIHSLSRAASEVPDALLCRFAEALQKAGLSNRVQVRLHPGITGPFVVGILRAVVYLPFSAVTHLSPSQLDAVLAHELEHIRRFDYLWNLIQTLVETLFFYHPAVWWLGRTLREQRELCCDDAALKACNDPLTYATALLRLEEQRPRAVRLANGLVMALNGQGEGSGLLSRITRMLGEAPAKAPSGRYNPFVAVPLILLSLSGFVVPAAQVAASTPAVKAIAAALPVPVPVAPAKPAKGTKTTQTIRIENGRVVSDETHVVSASESSANTKRIITVVDGRIATDDISELSEAEQAQIEARQEATKAQREAADEARREAEQANLEADQLRREADRERQQAQREAQQAERNAQREAERESQARVREQAYEARQRADALRIDAEGQRLRAESMLRAADRMATSAQEMAAKAETMRIKAMSLIAPPAPPVPPIPRTTLTPPSPPAPPTPVAPMVPATPPVPPVPPVPASYGVKAKVKVISPVVVRNINPNPRPNPQSNPQPDPRPNPVRVLTEHLD